MKTLAKHHVLRTVFSSVLCAISILLSAQGGQTGQSSIITEIPRTQAQLTIAQEAKISKLEQLDYVEEIRIVSVQDLSQAENKGYLPLTIPSTVGNHNLQMTRVKYENDHDYTISGTLVNSSSITVATSVWGYFSIVATAYGKGGYFHMNDEFYSLFPLDANRCLWIKGRSSNDKPDCLSIATSVSTPSSNLDFCEDDNDCTTEVRVMVLITPEAEAFFSMTETFPTPFSAAIYAAVGIESTNVALRRSEVSNKEISYFYKVVDFINLSSSIADDIGDLATHPQIQELRAMHHADLVVMLTDERYPLAAGAVNNVGCIEEHCAYAIVEAPEMLKPRWAFAHEVGHLLGALHNRSFNGGNDDTNICAHGFKFEDADGTTRRTLHALISDDDVAATAERILNYSNADVSFNGTPTGELRDNGESFAENAQYMKHATCVVATHFPPLEWSVYLDGPNRICQPFSFFYTSVINEPAVGFLGQAPYTYEWHWSLFATDDGEFLSNNTSLSISIINNSFLFNYEEFFLILTVNSSDGQSIRVRKKVEHPCTGLQNLSEPSSTVINASQISTQQKAVDFTVYPTISQGQISLTSPVTGSIDMTVVDLNGRIVEQTSMFTHAAETITLDISNFPTGSYFIRLTSDKATTTLPLFLIQP